MVAFRGLSFRFGLVAAAAALGCADALTVTYSGYLMDYTCYWGALSGKVAVDGSDVLAAPEDHKVGCMLLTDPPCLTAGYYMAEACGNGEYHPKFDLDADSLANAVAFLGDASSLLVTATGKVVDGVLVNASFSACTGSACDSVCSVSDGSACPAGVMDATCASNTVTYSGYIIDWYCYGQSMNGLPTPDGSHVINGPSEHKMGCLTGPTECTSSGFYLAEACSDGTYHPKFDLRQETAKVLDFLNNQTVTDDVMVTVVGTNTDGVLTNIEIYLCDARDSTQDAWRMCDSVCTGACGATTLDNCPSDSSGSALMAAPALAAGAAVGLSLFA